MLYNFYDFMLIKPSHCTENQTHLLILFHRILHCLTHVFPSTLSSVLSYFSTHKPSWTSFCPSNISSLPPPHLGFPISTQGWLLIVISGLISNATKDLSLVTRLMPNCFSYHCSFVFFRAHIIIWTYLIGLFIYMHYFI